MRRLLASTAALLAALSAQGEGLPREFTLTPEVIADTPAFLATVVVPDAQCAAVNEASKLLVIGRRGPDEKHLAVFHLDAEGKPAGEPAWLELPKPEALAGKTNYVLGVLFHPTLPVLYVWQDVDASKLEKDPERPKYADFDHLLVYAIKDGALELVQTGSPGSAFRCGFTSGTMGFDLGAKNLYVPNAMGTSWDEAGVVSYAIDEDGMPAEEPENASAARRKLIKNMSPVKKTSKLHLVPLPKQMHTSHYYPSGTGWYAGSEALVMGGMSGCLMFDLHDGNLRQTWFGMTDRPGVCSITAHASLPVLYIALQDESHLYAMGQVNGFLTLLPQIATVTGAHLFGLPALVTKHSRLAVGDSKGLHLFGLQEDGKLDGRDEQLKLPCALVKGFTYSEKFDRLYVAVDKEN